MQLSGPDCRRGCGRRDKFVAEPDFRRQLYGMRGPEQKGISSLINLSVAELRGFDLAPKAFFGLEKYNLGR